MDALAAALPASAWRRYRILEGARGPLVADFAVLRVVAVRLAASLVPLVGDVLLAGGATAYWSTRDSRSTPGRTAALGASAGLGALLAGVVAFTIFGFGLGSDPAVQAFMRAGKSHAAAHPPDAWAVAQGAVIGLGAGTINLAYASLGGLLVGIREGRGDADPPGAGPVTGRGHHRFGYDCRLGNHHRQRCDAERAPGSPVSGPSPAVSG